MAWSWCQLHSRKTTCQKPDDEEKPSVTYFADITYWDTKVLDSCIFFVVIKSFKCKWSTG